MYLVTGALQGCLLVMGIYFEVAARRSRGKSPLVVGRSGTRTPAEDALHLFVETDDEGHPVVENGGSARRGDVRRTQSERTPLLAGQSKKAARAGL